MRALLATALLALALTLPGPAAGAAEPDPCDAGGHTVLSNRFVRVYSADDEFFACSYENHRTMELGYVSSSSTGFYDVEDCMLAGRYVAYQRIECSGMGDSGCEVDDLILIDMRRPKVSLRHHFGDAEGLVSAVLKANGSIAYLYARGRPDGTEYILRRRDRRGRALLAVGLGSAGPSNLRLAGSRLEWTQDGRARSKTLR